MNRWHYTLCGLLLSCICSLSQTNFSQRAYDLNAPIGFHHRRVISERFLTNGVQPELSTNNSVVLLELGMNYLNEQGKLVPSDPLVEPSPAGAVTRRTPVTTIFSADVNVSGAVDINTPEGTRLRATPLGISYYDPVSGNSVLLAETRASRGQIIAPNKIVYEDFLDDIRADVIYEVRKSGVMQTVIIKEKLPPPAAFNLSDDSRLEVITEFVNPQTPQRKMHKLKGETDPVKRSQMVEPDFLDATLLFNELVLPQGVAFGVSADNPEQDPIRKRPVAKTWQDQPNEGRSILFEAVEYKSVKEQFDNLPETSKPTAMRTPERKRFVPEKRLALASSEPVLLAASPYRPTGVAIDFVAMYSASSLTFASGETYVVYGPPANGPYTIGSAYFQPGCVVKFEPNAALNINYWMTFHTDSLNPSIFTAYDDDSYGLPAPAYNGRPASTGQPTGANYANAALDISNLTAATGIQNAKFRFCKLGIAWYGTYPYNQSITACRFETCQTGISVQIPNLALANLHFCSTATQYIGNPQSTSGLVNDCDGPYLEVPKTAPMVATASTSTAGWTADRAIDGLVGNVYNSWHTDPATTQTSHGWLRIDLGSAKRIGKIKYHPREDYAHGTFTEYKIYVTSNYSNDPASWGTPVAYGKWSWLTTGTGDNMVVNTGQEREIEFVPQTGQYVIFQCIDSLIGWASALEVWVYESATAAPVATPAIFPGSGIFPAPARIQITSLTIGAQVWYTLDGSDPVQGSPSLQYNSSFLLQNQGTYTIKARAFASGMEPSQIQTAQLTVVTPLPGQYMEVPKLLNQLDASGSTFTLNWEPSRAIDASVSQNIPGWHTENSEANRYLYGWLRIDFGPGVTRPVGRVSYTPRADAVHGTFTRYHIYVTESPSSNPVDWGAPLEGADNVWAWSVVDGKIQNQTATVTFTPKTGRYVIFQCLESMQGWASAGEVSVYQSNLPSAPAPQIGIDPVAVFLKSSPATLVVSLSSTRPIQALTMNGSAIPVQTGEFTLSPTVIQGANSFTISATDDLNQTVQASTTVYLDSVAPVVTITSPANNASLTSSAIDVSGTVSDANIKRVYVNGVLAIVTGTSFQARNVPVASGPNTIIATAEDIAGNAGTASISATGGATLTDPVLLVATPVGGYAPLTVSFQPQTTAPGALQQVIYDFDGDGGSDLTRSDLTVATHTYSSPGQFFPVVTIVTSAGRFSSPGGWLPGYVPPSQRLRVNVQAPPIQVSSIGFTDPIDLQTTDDGNLYVLSRSASGIWQYNSGGAAVRSISSIGASPTGLGVDLAGNVYVALGGNHQVAKYKPSGGTFLLDPSFNNTGKIGRPDGTAGSNDGEFNTPVDVAVSPDGKEIAVSDSNNNRVQFFTTAGVFRTSFGSFGSAFGQLNSPKGLAFDFTETLFIADSGNNRIALVRDYGATALSGSEGTALGQFRSPKNIGIGARGLYIADPVNNRIQIFDPFGQSPEAALQPFRPRGSLGTEIPLNQPNAVSAIQSFTEERVFIADTANHRVLQIKFPVIDPLPAWNSMSQRLLANDIPGALTYLASSSTDRYRNIFTALSAQELSSSVSAIPTPTLVAIGATTAQYKFSRIINGVNITFPIQFSFENGVWKIVEF